MKTFYILYKGIKSVLYFKRIFETKRTIVMKTLVEEYPLPAHVQYLENEYNILLGRQLEGVRRVLSIEVSDGKPTLELEFIDGTSLVVVNEKNELLLSQKLEIAIQLFKTIDILHQSCIVHNNINPRNIIIENKTNLPILIDFSFACKFENLDNYKYNLEDLEESLSYQSPEHSGRINRRIDYRTDFYSVGMVLYELFSGQLPFESNDPIKLLHQHIAEVPVSPSSFNSTIFPVLDTIILKLLSKNAEDRYLSAYGVLCDLQKCLAFYQSNIENINFQIGLHDFSNKFKISSKVYGRNPQLEVGLKVYEKVSNGSFELLFVTGMSGIGKSSYVKELSKTVLHQKGFFIEGKFEISKQQVPYTALVLAFSDFVNQILSDNEKNFQQWKSAIKNAVGPNGGILTEIIPAFELIIGKQEAASPLNGLEAQNRFNYVLTNLLIRIASPRHPIVIFLEDMQWVDLATLALARNLLRNKQLKGVMLICTYRNDIVKKNNFTNNAWFEMIKRSHRVTSIVLQGLDHAALLELISDLLETDKGVDALTTLVLMKTNGNPFFIQQFLYELNDKNLIYFDRISHLWCWNLDDLEKEEITANVIELLTNKLIDIPSQAMELLQVSSCFGARFVISTLLKVVDIPPVAVEELMKVIKDRLYIIGDNQHQFIHERVRTAIYEMMPEEQKMNYHFKIGQLLLSENDKEWIQENIFEVVNHYNIGRSLIKSDHQRVQLFELNKLAALKAKQLAAFHSYAQYASVSVELMTEEAWTIDNQASLNTFQLAAESCFLSQDYDRMDYYLTELIANSKSAIDTIDAYEIKILSLIAQNKMREALKLGVSTLRLLDFKLKLQTSEEVFQSEFQSIQKKLAKLKSDDLKNSPLCLDVRIIGIGKILHSMLLPLHILAPTTVKTYCLEVINLSLTYGSNKYTPSSFAFYSHILAEKEIWDECRKYFNLSKSMSEMPAFSTTEGATLFVGSQMVGHYFMPISTILNSYSKCTSLSIDNGDFVSAGDSASMYLFTLFITGKPITDFFIELNHFRGIVENVKFQAQTSWIQLIYTAVKMIESDTDIEYEIKFDEIKLKLIQKHDNIGLSYWYLFRLIKNLIYERIENFEDIFEPMKQLQPLIKGQYIWYVYRFYETLALLRSIDSKAQFIKYQTQFDSVISQFDRLSKLSPANFSYKVELIKAEYFRVKGEHGLAIKGYENAYTKALELRLYNDAALASELAGQYWLEQGINRIAANYFGLAIFNYERWGINSKVEILKSKYKELLNKREGFNLSSNSKALNANSIDLTSVIKAYQAITSETKIGKLFSKMMNILMENSGAEKGMFILNEEGHWYIRASGDFKTDKFEILDYVVSQAQVKDYNEINIPKSVFNYCLRSKEYLVIEDAQIDSKFGSDEYFERNKTRSVICIPLMNQGKPMGILYLENNLTPGAFTNDKVKMLQLLTSQFSISVENALIYQSLENKIKERTRETNELNHHLREVNEELQESNVRLEERQEEVEKQAFELRIANKELQSQKAELVDALDRLKQTQSKLIQSEKMASLGVLIAGIAHEINNPVNFINANIKGLKLILDDMIALINQYDNVGPDNFEQVLEHIENEKNEMDFDGSINDISTVISNISNGAERTAEIVRSLKAFSYSDDGEKRMINIHENIDITLTMLHYKYKNKIDIYKTYNDVPKIMCMPGRINQVIMNILTNAIDSINSKPETSEIESINIQTNVVNVNGKEYVGITIIDTGTGIPDKIKDRIFEPFFTTKDVGEGTGLGLSISHGIIQNHNGHIIVTDKPGGGAVFTINLPIEGGY